MLRLKYLLFFSIFLYNGYAYKILGIHHMPTRSHYILASRLMQEIAKRGHEVTFITPYPAKTPFKNIKEIPIESLQEATGGNIPALDLEDKSPMAKAFYLMNIQTALTEKLYSSDEFQKLIKSGEKFDAVVLYQYMNDGMLPIANLFKAPLILFSSMPLFASENFVLSHPTPSSYVPNILTEYTGRMNFWQRIRNSFYDVWMILHYYWVMLPQHQALATKYLPGSPNIYNLLNNASLLLINSHVSTNEALPIVPNAVEIGGYHINEPKPLPNHLEKFLNESNNGVILFSMGTIIRSCDFPKDKRDSVIKAFAKLKENVLWKWEDEDNIPELPKNVKTMKWIPQSDVLAHPNVKAFLSHGGLLSTMESVYHGKPIVGIPVFSDQKMNMAIARSYEYAIELPYQQLTEERLTEALHQVLNNPKYKENIERRSRIMKDRAISPADNAVYWVEYVIRHKGAPHLRYPGMDLTWIQRNMLDITAFVIGSFILTVYCITILLKSLCQKKKHKTE